MSNLGVPRCKLERTKQRIDYVGGNMYNLKLIGRISTLKSLCKEYLCGLIDEENRINVTIIRY